MITNIVKTIVDAYNILANILSSLSNPEGNVILANPVVMTIRYIIIVNIFILKFGYNSYSKYTKNNYQSKKNKGK